MNFTFVTRSLGTVPSAVINNTLATIIHDCRSRAAKRCARKGVETRRANREARLQAKQVAEERRQMADNAEMNLAALVRGTSPVNGVNKLASKLEQRARRTIADRRNGFHMTA